MAAKTQTGDGRTTVDMSSPEIITREQLIDALRQKQVDISSLNGMDKESLRQMYYDQVMPMPQRKYRLNRRGRTATKQQVSALKRKRTHDESSAASSTCTNGSETTKESGRFLCSFSPPKSTPPPPLNRLKPPPVNVERKIIRLKPTTTSADDNPPRSGSQPAGGKTKAGGDTDDGGGGGGRRSHVTAAAAAREEAAVNPNVTVRSVGQGGTLVKITPAKTATASATPVKTKSVKLNRKSITTTPSQTQETKGATAKSEMNVSSPPSTPNTEPTVKSDQNSNTQQECEEEVAPKKFKKVSITWP